MEPEPELAELMSNELKLNEEELADVLVVLHPLSAGAVHVVEYTAQHRPEHVLFRDDKPQTNSVMAAEKSDTVPDEPRTAVLALRMSSAQKLRSKTLGIIFGRNPNVADIVFSRDLGKRTSNQHCRIHVVGPRARLMLTDMSTNGTLVNGKRIGGRNATFLRSCEIKQGSIVTIATAPSPEFQLSQTNLRKANDPAQENGDIKFLIRTSLQTSRPKIFHENLVKFIEECSQERNESYVPDGAVWTRSVGFRNLSPSKTPNKNEQTTGAEEAIDSALESIRRQEVPHVDRQEQEESARQGLGTNESSRSAGNDSSIIRNFPDVGPVLQEAQRENEKHQKRLQPPAQDFSPDRFDPVDRHEIALSTHSSAGSIGSHFASSASKPPNSMFDGQSLWKSVIPSTLPTSLGIHKNEVKIREEYLENSIDEDSETIYSADSVPEDPASEYILAFVRRLNQDLQETYGISNIKMLPSSYINDVMRAFTWRLHGESSDPFQLEASFVLHRQRRKIVGILVGNESIRTTSEMHSNDDESGDENPRQPFRKTAEDLSNWVSDVSTSELEVQQLPDHLDVEELQLFQLADYERFVQHSDAYRWLLSKMYQRERLSSGNLDTMTDIGTSILSRLKTQDPPLKISRRRPLPLVHISFHLEWDPKRYLLDLGVDPESHNALDNTFCLTGTWNDAQAMSISEYIGQTWPVSGEAIGIILKKLISCAYNDEITHIDELPGIKSAQVTARSESTGLCTISMTGGVYAVSELAQQIAWLAATLRPPQMDVSIMSCQPRVSDITVQNISDGDSEITISADCYFTFEFSAANENLASDSGFCWGPLFDKQVLVTGFPTLRRPTVGTGLEMSLSVISAVVGSDHVISYGERIIIKGFDSLLIATLVTESIILWHLLISDTPGERIAYYDTRLDSLKSDVQTYRSLHGLEVARHIVGWCSKATDFCGDERANCNISASGLLPSPSATIIDRMYIEGGLNIIGGINLRPNQKEQPVKLHRERDFPELLQMVAAHPVAFYDVEDRRAWLVDGASALLQLVRISLHLDATDPESPYDWVFDSTKIINTGNGCTGRIAALRLLKDWSIRNLPVYVKGQSNEGGQLVPRFSTFGDRVDKILSWLEVIIDRDAYLASQDGIKVSQTLDRRKSISGFDALDIIKPLGPIGTRSAYFDSWGDGWIDFFHSTGVSTIFGKGFGDLIHPDSSDQVCTEWSTVPTGMDYMIASISTLKLVREKRLKRINPSLGNGEWGRNILWMSPCHPFKPCGCVNNSATTSTHNHLDPVQFLVMKRAWNMARKPKDMALINMESLDERGAVVFANLTLFGLRYLPKDKERKKDSSKDTGSSSLSDNGSQLATPSASASWSGQSPSSENITTPSEESADGEVIETDHTGKRKNESRIDRVKKRLDRFGRR